MARLRRSFETRIERRVVVLLFVSCMLPLLVLTWGAGRIIEHQSLDGAQRHLGEFSKDYALDLIDRLEMAVWELSHRTPGLSEEEWGWVQLEGVVPRPDGLDKPALTSRAHGFTLLVPVGDQARRGFVPDEVLFSDLDHAPFGIRGCVLVAGEVRRCGDAISGSGILTARWTLPLGSLYQTGLSIEVVSTQTREAALGHLGLANTLLPYAVLIVMALASWWVLKRVRARLAPIAELRRATERISLGDYEHRVMIRSGDEFEGLGDGFNAMTRELGESFATMRALSAMDHMILNSADLGDLVRRALELMRDRGVTGGLVWLWEVQESGSGEVLRLDPEGRLIAERSAVPAGDDRTEAAARRELGNLRAADLSVAYPILRDGALAGLLAVTQPAAEDEDRIDTLAEIADRISVAVTLYARATALYQQAHYDGLTGLLNREAFTDRIGQAAAAAVRDAGRGALLCLDLDRFKQVNDTAGHQVGDRLLAQVARRLHKALRASDEAARLGGDEFAVLVAKIEDPADLESLCRRLMEEISRPVDVDGHALVVEASIGVVVFPEDGADASVLMRKADVAMYKAKEQSGSAFTFFDEAMNRETEQRAQIENRLRRALRDRELCLYFQPKVRVSDGAVVGVEGLLRWPAAKDLHPGLFIPVAEHTGLIHEFTDILIEDSMACLQQCRARGHALERVAVNVSPRQFQREGFAESFLGRLAAHGADPADFEVEVTESTLMHDPGAVAQELDTLRAAGVTVALDDFGTGYSSLNVLRELPLDVIKIDRSFVAPIAESAQARDLLGRIIDIIRSLDLRCVAEGVETEREMQILVARQCDVVQGYLFSPALSVAGLLEYLESPQARSA